MPYYRQPLIRGLLLRRYRRFLADVRLEDGQELTVHCPNPGAMTGLATPGMTVWLEPRGGGGRLPFSWRQTGTGDGGRAGIDSSAANAVAHEALLSGHISGFAGHSIAREVTCTPGTRLDFLLTRTGLPPCWLEVKSVQMRRDGLAVFPDCPTARGARHMEVLAGLADHGARAAVLFIVQRDDCSGLGIARDIDPRYGERLAAAVRRGVRVLALDCRLSREGIFPRNPLPFRDSVPAPPAFPPPAAAFSPGDRAGA